MPLLPRHREQVAAFQARRRGRPSLHVLTVEEITRLTEDSVMVGLAVPEHLRDAYRFTPGQHVTIVRAEGEGQLRRSYSICTPAGSEGLRIAIRRVPGGVFSGYAIERLRVGETLGVLTPTGRFTVQPDVRANRHYAAVAGGSGITPILSMVSTILAVEARSRVTLLYANRTRSSTMFRDELDRLQDEHGERLSVHHYLSREADAGLPPRRLGSDSVQALLAAESAGRPVDRWIMCGPAGLMQEVTTSLRERGVAEETISRELFTAGPADEDHGHDRPLVHSEVTLRIDGTESTLEISSRGPTVLAAALPQLPDLPYSCSDGVCATCRVKVVEGAVEMDRCSALDRTEIARGYVLACQAHPVTEKVVLDFDE